MGTAAGPRCWPIGSRREEAEGPSGRTREAPPRLPRPGLTGCQTFPEGPRPRGPAGASCAEPREVPGSGFQCLVTENQPNAARLCGPVPGWVDGAGAAGRRRGEAARQEGVAGWPLPGGFSPFKAKLRPRCCPLPDRHFRARAAAPAPVGSHGRPGPSASRRSGRRQNPCCSRLPRFTHPPVGSQAF